MEQKQRDNPEFAFLLGGEGSAYYKWALYSKLLEEEQQQQTGAPSQALLHLAAEVQLWTDCTDTEEQHLSQRCQESHGLLSSRRQMCSVQTPRPSLQTLRPTSRHCCQA